ncbi:glycosyltransferase family 2 protein [Chryseobacterium piperi]|nr:glycosyltransferase [Chryseobacterium piperi]
MVDSEKYTKISVLMACYNVERYIGIALDSVLVQTYPHFEVLCVDDCSSDDTLNILEDYCKKDERIKVFRNSENLGITKTKNVLLSLAMNETVVFLDGDDISDIHRFEKLLHCKNLYNADIVSSAYTLIGSSGQKLKTRGLQLLTTKMGIRYTSFFNSPIPHAPSMINRSLIEDRGGYKEDYIAAEDYDLFVDILLQKEVIVKILPCPLYLYRINEDGISRSYNKSQIESHIKIAKKFILKELSTDPENFHYWNLSKYEDTVKIYPYSFLNTALNQINYIRKTYLNKYSVSSAERQEINDYTSQYYIFTYLCMLRNGIKYNQVIKVSALITVSFVRNFFLIFNLSTFKWIRKQI